MLSTLEMYVLSFATFSLLTLLCLLDQVGSLSMGNNHEFEMAAKVEKARII